MSASYDTEQQIRTTLHGYCEAMDDADFDAFAAFFKHGRWFMVSEPGSESVRAWLDRNIVLYDGRTLTRHEIANLVIESPEVSDEASFRCYVTIWQDLPDEVPRLLAHVRFSGTFRLLDGKWWWHDHAMRATYAADLSSHIKDALAA